MFNLEDLKVARKNIAEKRSGSAETAYHDGVKVMDLFQLKPSITRLDEASKKFIEALEYNSQHLPSIIYISYILYALENDEMALKYIKMAERLVPVLPPQIVSFKEKIERRIR
jgi:hypothetical protein